MTDFGRLAAYYARFDEWGRSHSPAGQLEYARASQIIRRHIAPMSRVLDLGGGPGRFAISLAQDGHELYLADISYEQLQEAIAHIADAGVGERVVSLQQVNAIDLSVYPDSCFDVVLMLGPFHHLLEEEERRRCAAECWRVLRPNGRLFVSYLPALSGIAGLMTRAAIDPEQVPAAVFAEAAHYGSFRNPIERGFQEAFFCDSNYLSGLFDAHGFTVIEQVSLRGLGFEREQELLAVRESAPDTYREILNVIEATERDPRVIETSGQALLVAQRG